MSTSTWKHKNLFGFITRKPIIKEKKAFIHHFFIGLQRDLEDVSLLSLSQEEEHGLGFVGGWADKDHAALRVIQVVL